MTKNQNLFVLTFFYPPFLTRKNRIKIKRKTLITVSSSSWLRTLIASQPSSFVHKHVELVLMTKVQVKFSNFHSRTFNFPVLRSWNFHIFISIFSRWLVSLTKLQCDPNKIKNPHQCVIINIIIMIPFQVHCEWKLIFFLTLLKIENSIVCFPYAVRTVPAHQS